MLGRCTLCSSGNLITSRRSLGTRRRSRQSSISTRRTLAVHTGRPTTGTALRPTTGCWSCATGCRIRRKRRCYFALLPCHFFLCYGIIQLSTCRDFAPKPLISSSVLWCCAGGDGHLQGAAHCPGALHPQHLQRVEGRCVLGLCNLCEAFQTPARPVWVKSQNENDTFRSYLHSLVSPQECRTTSPRCWRSTS